MTPEGKVKKKFKEHVLKKYGENVRLLMPVTGGWGQSALDFAGCYRGFYFEYEAKAEGGKPSERQEGIIEAVQRAGGTAGWHDTAERMIEAFDEWARRIDEIVVFMDRKGILRNRQF